MLSELDEILSGQTKESNYSKINKNFSILNSASSKLSEDLLTESNARSAADDALRKELNTLIDTSVKSHISDKSNPHGVTITQIGAEPAFTKNSAFNKNFGTDTPVMDGVASAGTSDSVSKSDHVHPTDTTRASVTYVDEVAKIDKTAGTTVAVGGLSKGTNLNGKSVSEVLESILFPYVAPTGVGFSLTPAATTYENGQELSVTSGQVRWSAGSDNITKVVILKGSTELGSTLGNALMSPQSVPLTAPLLVSSNTTLTAKVTDGKNSPTVSATYTFYNRVYWGVGPKVDASDTDALSALLLGWVTSGSVLTNANVGEFKVNAGTDEYIYYAKPTSITKDPSFFVGGFEGGFNKLIDSFKFTNQYNYSTMYEVWISKNPSLGDTTITLK